MYFYGGTALLQWWLKSPRRKESCTILPFFFYTLPVDRLLQLVQLSYYIKQVNPPKFNLQHLVWGSYLSSLQNGAKCKTWLNSPGSPLLSPSTRQAPGSSPRPGGRPASAFFSTLPSFLLREFFRTFPTKSTKVLRLKKKTNKQTNKQTKPVPWNICVACVRVNLT